MEQNPVVSAEVLARYAADAALEVEGVSALGTGTHHRGSGVEVAGEAHAPSVRIAIELAWGASAAEVGAAVQSRVVDYLERMAEARPASVDVVVDAVGPPPAKR